jgi:hypothetical protein
MEYEVLVDNKYMKSLRLSYGVLIHIYKHEHDYSINDVKSTRKAFKKIDEGFYETKEIVTGGWSTNKREHPIGTICRKDGCNYYPITKVCEDKADWHWEIKTTGSCLSGDTDKFTKIIETIQKIIEEE